MNKYISILIISVLPTLVMASGDHIHGEQHENTQQDSHDMKGMEHEHHEAIVRRAGFPNKVTRTIKIVMDDNMRFTPNQIQFKSGETIRFEVQNNGKIRHEMVIGTVEELQEHANMMRTNPTMKHTDPGSISLAAGEQGDLIWQFTQPGSFDFACLVPGHLEAGMTGKIEVR